MEGPARTSSNCRRNMGLPSCLSATRRRRAGTGPSRPNRSSRGPVRHRCRRPAARHRARPQHHRPAPRGTGSLPLHWESPQPSNLLAPRCSAVVPRVPLPGQSQHVGRHGVSAYVPCTGDNHHADAKEAGWRVPPPRRPALPGSCLVSVWHRPLSPGLRRGSGCRASLDRLELGHAPLTRRPARERPGDGITRHRPEHRERGVDLVRLVDHRVVDEGDG